MVVTVVKRVVRAAHFFALFLDGASDPSATVETGLSNSAVRRRRYCPVVNSPSTPSGSCVLWLTVARILSPPSKVLTLETRFFRQIT